MDEDENKNEDENENKHEHENEKENEKEKEKEKENNLPRWIYETCVRHAVHACATQISTWGSLLVERHGGCG